MKNVKFFLFAAFTAVAAATLPAAPAWSDTASAAPAVAPQQAAAAPTDECVVNPATVTAPAIHPTKKLVHLHATPATKARSKALARLRVRHPSNLPVAINICPPTPAPIAQIVQKSLCRAALGASETMTSQQVEAMLVEAGYNANPATLTPAMSKAMLAHPEAAPALYAYALQHTNPADQNAVLTVSKTAYASAPGQAAGLAYGGILANPGETLLITQTLLANATPADQSAIRQCAVDANPGLANQIATAAFIPALAQPELAAINQNDIRNSINNASGTVTLVPGLPAREKDDSAT